MRVVAMFRVSTEKQANEGASLDAQQRKFRELAIASGWITVEEFRGCESAMQAATERQVLQQVLECIRREAPDALYVHEQSRLSRGEPSQTDRRLRRRWLPPAEDITLTLTRPPSVSEAASFFLLHNKEHAS